MAARFSDEQIPIGPLYDRPDTFSGKDDILETFTAYFVGFTSSSVLLFLFGVIKTEMSADEIIGKISLQAVTAALGAILVFGVLGFMFYQAVAQKAAPPEFLFRIDSIIEAQNGYLVKFEIENAGTETAADVLIEGELRNGTETLEKNTVTLNYVPSHSRSRGGLYFRKNPREFSLQLRVAGYAAP